jgi:hypothetical protein
VGSEPELRHARVELSTRSRGHEFAERVILVHPKKEASGALNERRVGARVRDFEVVHLNPIEVVGFLLPEVSAAGGSTVSVQPPLLSIAGRASGATLGVIISNPQ